MLDEKIFIDKILGREGIGEIFAPFSEKLGVNLVKSREYSAEDNTKPTVVFGDDIVLNASDENVVCHGNFANDGSFFRFTIFPKGKGCHVFLKKGAEEYVYSFDQKDNENITLGVFNRTSGYTWKEMRGGEFYPSLTGDMIEEYGVIADDSVECSSLRDVSDYLATSIYEYTKKVSNKK